MARNQDRLSDPLGDPVSKQRLPDRTALSILTRTVTKLFALMDSDADDAVVLEWARHLRATNEDIIARAPGLKKRKART